VILPLSLFRVQNHVCLSRNVQVTGVIWQAAIRIVAAVGDLVQRTRDGQTQIGYLMAGCSRDQVTLCAVCTVHKKTRNMCFLVEPQNQAGYSLLVVWHQNHWDGFPSLDFKIESCGLIIWASITMTVSWFKPQIQADYGLSVLS
jgi:hypothetical protein